MPGALAWHRPCATPEQGQPCARVNTFRRHALHGPAPFECGWCGMHATMPAGHGIGSAGVPRARTRARCANIREVALKEGVF